MWKKSLAMIAMVGICGGMYASEAYTSGTEKIRKVSPSDYDLTTLVQEVPSADRDLSTWDLPENLNRSGSLQIRRINAEQGEICSAVLNEAIPFKDLDSATCKEILDSPEKWKEFVDRVKNTLRYIQHGDGKVAILCSYPSPEIVEGDGWLQMTLARGRAVKFDTLIKVPHLIISAGYADSSRILLNAIEGRPFLLKGIVDFQNSNIDLTHSEIESFATKNIAEKKG